MNRPVKYVTPPPRENPAPNPFRLAGLFDNEDGEASTGSTPGPAATDTPRCSPLLSGLRTAAWLDQQTFPALAWHVPGIVAEGMSLLAGSPKAGKSWLSLDIALAVSAGGHALGKVKVRKRPVLLLALEDGDRRLQERMRRLQPDGPLPDGLAYLTDVKPGLILDTITAWLDTLPNIGPAPLIILDTLGKAMPPAGRGESGYSHDYAFMSQLKRVVDGWPGAALLAIHHTRKMAADDFLDAVSGTQGIAGAADSVIVLRRRRQESEGQIQVTGRDVDESEYALTFDGQWLLDGADLAAAARAATERQQTENISDESAAILRYVGEHPEGIAPKDVAAALGIDNKTAGTYLGRLADSGRIRREGRGKYTPHAVDPRESVESVETGTLEDNPFNTSTLSTPPQAVCESCGEPLAASLIAAGDTTHWGCVR